MVIGLECSSDRCSVALADEHFVTERSVRQPGEQLRLLLPMALELLAERGVAATSLDRIGVSIGPGSFTGLRLALTTARTMAQVLERPVVPVATLDVIAWGLMVRDCPPPPNPLPHGGRGLPDVSRICVMTDARKGQIFAACYDVIETARLSRVGEYEVLDPPDAAAWLDARAGEATLLGGSALDRYGALLRGKVPFEATLEDAVPQARQVALATLGRYGEIAAVGFDEIMPLYLRPPDVKKPKLPPLRALS